MSAIHAYKHFSAHISTYSAYFFRVEYAQHWIKKILDRLGLPPPPHPGTLKIDKRPGRLGQPQVCVLR